MSIINIANNIFFTKKRKSKPFFQPKWQYLVSPVENLSISHLFLLTLRLQTDGHDLHREHLSEIYELIQFHTIRVIII